MVWKSRGVALKRVQSGLLSSSDPVNPKLAIYRVIITLLFCSFSPCFQLEQNSSSHSSSQNTRQPTKIWLEMLRVKVEGFLWCDPPSPFEWLLKYCISNTVSKPHQQGLLTLNSFAPFGVMELIFSLTCVFWNVLVPNSSGQIWVHSSSKILTHQIMFIIILSYYLSFPLVMNFIIIFFSKILTTHKTFLKPGPGPKLTHTLQLLQFNCMQRSLQDNTNNSQLQPFGPKSTEFQVMLTVQCWVLSIWLSCQASGWVRVFSLAVRDVLQVLILEYHGSDSRLLGHVDFSNRNCRSSPALPQASQRIGP